MRVFNPDGIELSCDKDQLDLLLSAGFTTEPKKEEPKEEPAVEPKDVPVGKKITIKKPS